MKRARAGHCAAAVAWTVATRARESADKTLSVIQEKLALHFPER